MASVCNAVMDTLAHHYSTSAFKDLDNRFWNAAVSWKNKYINYDGGDKRLKKWFWIINKPVQLSDGWHLFKTLMIIFIILAVVFHKNVDCFITVNTCWNGLIQLFIFGVVWNITFSLFYNHILRKK